MEPVLPLAAENSSNKRRKIHRTRLDIARKVIAFQEIINLQQTKKSARETAHFLEVPNSTMQSWRQQSSHDELESFFLTPLGSAFLQRSIIAVMKLMKCGPCGIRGVKEFLICSGLNRFVAASEGALQNFWARCEECILTFGELEESKLAYGMKHKKITAGLDEMFRGSRPCLVAIEVVSNYILLEKFTEDRKKETWQKELTERLEGLNVTIDQIVSDLCGAIRACAKELNAEHIPELFHVQHEICKAVSAPLGSQARAVEKELITAEEKVRKLTCAPRRLIIEERKRQDEQRKKAEANRDKLQIERDITTKRKERAKSAIKEIGKLHHPIDLQTGEVQTAKKIEERFMEQLKELEKGAQEAGLKQSSLNRLAKARRALNGIVAYLAYFFTLYDCFISQLQLTPEQVVFFKDAIFPLAYLKMIWRRLSKKEKLELLDLKTQLETKIRDGPWTEALKYAWSIKGKELAERFQRSSSCVEGRNGVLSLNHHRFHRLNKKSLKVLTIVHNFGIKRRDGTTAAERFFGKKHEDLFESLVKNVAIPGRPRKQQHRRRRLMAA